jgi:hypothetical protein
MFQLPKDFTHRDDALHAVKLLYMVSQALNDAINMAHHLINAENMQQIVAYRAINQAKLTKIHTQIGVLMGMYELRESEIRDIEAEVFGYDSTLG